ncbi:MAG: ATP-binding cassette domain-containing protein [Alphaproteobacteria bacterium]|nr:ATP-binding cassette domain-containing protein [Alphaproteobacteria bacterium]
MKNVGLSYGDNPAVLSNIDFAFRRGSLHFLTGKSGAGKTSLLSMLYLAQKPTEGTLKVFGSNVSLTDRDTLAFLRRRIGVVFQDFILLDHLSVFYNVALPLRLKGMKEKEIRHRVIELLAWVELKDNMYVKSSEISGGEKQRAAIARAVINRPELLLADEPTGNVDSEIAQKLMKLFLELNRLGTTVVIATHSNELMERYPYPRLKLENGALTYVK